MLLFACNPARHVPDGKYLLVKNKIETDTSILPLESFDTHIKQKPNRKILGLFRFHLWVYNIGASGKEKKFKSWLRSIGEPPVILDSTLTERTKQQFELFLNKNGFFNATIKEDIKKRKSKRATAIYHVNYNESYTLRNIRYTTQDAGITHFISEYRNNSLLKPGMRYNEEVMEEERERITKDLKDKGYYFFNRNYITYQVDSTLGSHQTDIYLYLNRVNENTGASSGISLPVLDHQSYRIRNIYIHTGFDPKDPTYSLPPDTILYNGYYFLLTGEKTVVRKNVLLKNIFVKKGDTYLQSDIDFTYKKLQELNLFKFINLIFKEVPRDSEQQEYLLDLNIQLTQMDKQDFTIESEATNTGGNIGIAGSFGWRNKNLFRGAETFELKLKGGLEAIPNFNEAEETKRLYFFNTYELGPEISLGLKKLLFLENLEKKFFRESNPRTNLVLGYNQQDRPDYKRSIINSSFSWNVSFSKRVRVSWFVADINSVRVNLSPEFRAKLESLNDPRLLYTYDTHIISSTRPTLIYSNQNLGKKKDFIFLRVTPELAVPLFRQSLNPSAFFKADFDFSYHHIVNKYNNVVYRIAAGYGLPYGNSRALPFEKSFFSGGANSIRAWSARTLGPGSYKKLINIEQGGDIKIEGNIEYRSELIKFSNGIVIEAATFIDAGNIWTRNEDESRPGGQFKWENVIEELGVGGGSGLRFNFSFFILRLDAAVKLRDPSYDLSERWVYPNQKFVFSDINWNLAIGYPF